VRKEAALDTIKGVWTVAHFWIYQKSVRDVTGGSNTSSAVNGAGKLAVDIRIL
jgi:hypothetical protein